jgi:hypothetical protein
VNEAKSRKVWMITQFKINATIWWFKGKEAEEESVEDERKMEDEQMTRFSSAKKAIV